MGAEFDQRFREWYTDGATHFDSRFGGKFAELERGWILELVQPLAGMTILDVGTGTGRASLALAADSDANVIGLDITLAMLREAQRKRDAADQEYPLFVNANARKMPFPSETFDAVISIRTLHLFPVTYWGSFVDEMRRVLKPGGTLLVEFDSPLAGFGWGILRDLQRHLARRKNRYYLWPHQMRPLFSGMESCEAFGFWFPGIGQAAKCSEHLTPLLRLARLRPPFGYLGNHVLVRSRKSLAEPRALTSSANALARWGPEPEPTGWRVRFASAVRW